MAKGVVLYVEDEADDVVFMERAFARTEPDVVLKTVSNGLEAIDYLSGRGRFANRVESPLPSVVLMDLNLPVMSGFEALSWIRQQSECRTLPVIVFSSSSRVEDKQRAFECGANEYVEKPNSAVSFVVVVEHLMRWLTGPEEKSA